MHASWLWCLPVVVLSACGSFADGLPPARVEGLPWQDTPIDRQARRARDLVEQGEAPAALALLADILAAEPRHTDALRLRQDVLRERGRRGVLLAEAERAVGADPNDAIAHYLLGRVVLDPMAKLRSFARAVDLAPQSVWPWLGLAHSCRATDPERSLAIYERLFHASGAHPLVGVAYAAALREAERFDGAARVYEWLQRDARVPGVGDLGLAQLGIAQDVRGAGWSPLLAAMRQRPFDAGVQALVLAWLETGVSSDQLDELLDVLGEDAARWRAFGQGDGGLVLALLLQRCGQPAAARAALSRVATSPATPARRRLLRRLALGVGDVGAFLRQVREDVPQHVVDVEANQVRGRWLRLLHGPWHEGDPLATAEQAAQLLTALRDVGWLAEVELAAEAALVRWSGVVAIESLRDEARRELAFEAALRRQLYRGYQQQDRSTLATVVDRIRDVSVRILGKDVVGTPTTFQAPLVGEMLDPFVGGLADHLAGYNKHLVLGRRAGGVAEGLLFTRLSIAELPVVTELHLPGRCFEVIGIDRDVKSLGGVLGGDLAGVALLNHFLVDHDAVRDWARSVADRRRIVTADGMALSTDPLPSTDRDDPADVSWRLAMLSPVPDQDLDAAVLDTIRAHERQHLVDAFRYLPIEQNLWRGLGLLVSFTFSPAAIEAEMERRAELAALATTPHAEIVLAHIADFLAEPGASPHHDGFGQLAADLVRELQRMGLTAAEAHPSRWHLVSRSLVQQAARHLLQRLH